LSEPTEIIIDEDVFTFLYTYIGVR